MSLGEMLFGPLRLGDFQAPKAVIWLEPGGDALDREDEETMLTTALQELAMLVTTSW